MVVSKILYVLPLCGGAPEYMLAAVQRKMNEAMRVVTRRRWAVLGRRLTSNAELLRQCNYLSVKQMVYYHSVALVHKVVVHQAPVHLYLIIRRALASGVRHQYGRHSGGGAGAAGGSQLELEVAGGGAVCRTTGAASGRGEPAE